MKKGILVGLFTILLAFCFIACGEATIYTVTFDGAGIIENREVGVRYENTVEKPEDPVVEGYNFVGWFVGENEYDFATPVTENITIVAKFSAIEYTVAFNTDGGNAIDAQTIAYNGKAQKPVDPEKEGYNFVGWFVGENEYDFASVVTESIEIVAKWQIKTFAVTFDSNGAEAVEDQTVNYNEKAQKPADPQKAGFVFVGWYAGENKYDFETPVTSPVELVAVYEEEIVFEDVIGSWAGEEVAYGMSFATYSIIINADGTGSGSYTMQGYEMPMSITGFTVANNRLVMAYDGKTHEFAIKEGKLVAAGINSGSYGTVELAPSNIVIADLANVYEGAEEVSGMSVPYTLTVTDAGVSVKMDMFGSVSELEVVELSNKLVLSYYGLDFVLVYDGEKFVGNGAMGGSLVLTEKVVVPQEPITIDAIVGSWAGKEITAYGNYDYTFTVKADGTGNGVYVDEAGAYPTDFEITSIVINGNKVTLSAIIETMEYSIEFTYADGVMNSNMGFVWGTLTVEKVITVADIAGKYEGAENFYGMDFEGYMVINADGTGSADFDGMTATITAVTISGNTVTVVHDMGTTVFTYADGVMTSDAGFMGGTISVEKVMTVADIAGRYEGAENFYGMNFEGYMVINADG
ncbi:MAG: InlB B-repeat-containing protein, partial [Clostridia bacterium]|nr:InlB B-repeat-containing protein [Clostridia bacterium]